MKPSSVTTGETREKACSVRCAYRCPWLALLAVATGAGVTVDEVPTLVAKLGVVSVEKSSFSMRMCGFGDANGEDEPDEMSGEFHRKTERAVEAKRATVSELKGTEKDGEEGVVVVVVVGGWKLKWKRGSYGSSTPIKHAEHQQFRRLSLAVVARSSVVDLAAWNDASKVLLSVGIDDHNTIGVEGSRAVVVLTDSNNAQLPGASGGRPGDTPVLSLLLLPWPACVVDAGVS